MKINPVESLPNLTNTAPRQILLGTELDEKSSSEQFLLSMYDSVQTMEIERERLLEAIANRIRQFENLEIILQQTVKEIRHFLECDRILIYKFEPDNSGVIIAESTILTGDSLLGKKIKYPCLEIHHQECYGCGCIHVIDDIYATGLNPCEIDFLTSMQVRANLVVPILLQHNLWGLLIVQHGQEKCKWQQQEIDLCKQIALQICIAVQQAELQKQVKYLQEQLELQNQQHTSQLNQTQSFQTLLRKLTEQIRDSWEADQVLQTAVKELAQLLQLEGCYIELYNQCQTSATVTYEYSYSSPHDHGLTRKVLDFPKIYQPLLQKQILQSLEILPGWNTQVKIVSQLACPIFDRQGILGNIWLTKSTEEKFEQFEISLVQEVANECAIAIRQSQLQEKTKAQVKELEKRERYKNEFLKTLAQELRTPITSISLAAQTLESLLTPNIIENIEIVPQLLQILNNECGRESKLINDLLTLTYLKSAPEPPTLITIDLETWLTPIVESFRDVANCQRQNLNLNVATKIPPLETDITDFERIITALLNHACKYTPTGESITISANLNADTLELKVCHTGVEIPNHEIAQVFQPFYCFTNNAPWKSSDSGLELALVKAMVKRLNGSINIKSGDRQITFTIKFPL